MKNCSSYGTHPITIMHQWHKSTLSLLSLPFLTHTNTKCYSLLHSTLIIFRLFYEHFLRPNSTSDAIDSHTSNIGYTGCYLERYKKKWFIRKKKKNRHAAGKSHFHINPLSFRVYYVCLCSNCLKLVHSSSTRVWLLCKIIGNMKLVPHEFRCAIIFFTYSCETLHISNHWASLFS